jgi:hypothetical protein
MLRRTLALAAFLLASVPVAVAAQEYPMGDDESLAVSDSSVTPGQTIGFEGRDYAGGSSATMMLFSAPRDLGTFTAGADGVVSGDVTIPADTSPGAHTLELSGTDPEGGAQVLTARITVVGGSDAAADDDRDQGGLAFTGSMSMPLVTVGAILAVLGTAVILVSRRRSPA